VKYNRRGGSITVSCEPRDDDYVRVAVQDTGIGIPSERRAELFTSFQRLGRENSTVEGTGIGLVITKRLTEMMSGRIGFDSELGVGSTFWVEFPAARTTDTAPVATTEAAAGEPGADEGTATQTVLYVEDNPANLRFMERLIARQPNIRLLSAPEPGLGLELARAHRPDLILLDINLPGMDGYEALRRLRDDVATAHIPVIAVTANAMPHEVELGNAAGFDGYVTKPINVALFLQVLGDALRVRRNTDARQ
jgi:CheY-like chemotaxis protein